VNVLVDTSVWSLALRRKPQHLNPAEQSIVGELTQLVKEGRARIIGVVRQELLSGIRSAPQYEKLRADLRAFPDDEIRTADHESAAKASNNCRTKGIVVSLVDVLICTVAIGRGWSVFTTDPDFKNYSRALPIKLHSSRK
jgi:predicted nucleic acid-binding protein